MTKKVYETLIDAPVEAVWEFHQSVEALKALTPPGRRVEVLSEDTAVRDGAIHRLKVRQFGIPLIWEAEISEVDPPNGFTDTARASPFRVWKHRHAFIAEGSKTRLKDTVEYEAPFGFLGRIADKLFISRDIDRLFAFRHRATQQSLERKSG